MNAPSREPNSPTSLSSPSSTSFIPAVTTVAVAQICRSTGYTAAEPSALRSLSAIAALYIQTLARSSSSIANSKSRTQSNLLDLIRAIEDLTLTHRGFVGGSDPTKPPLGSSILKELRGFVRLVREVPFAKPILREVSDSKARVPRASFAEMGMEPPKPHVPRWLPCYTTEGLEGENRKERGEERKRWEERGGLIETEEEADGGENSVGDNLGKKSNGVLLSMAEREYLKFELVNANSLHYSLRKRRKLMLGDEEE